MSTPFASAAAAYGNAAQLISERAAGKGATPAPASEGGDFSKMVAEQMNAVTDMGKASDQLAMDMVNGKANVVDVVTALSQTETTMETMVTVRDRVISAYQEIMRMPI